MQAIILAAGMGKRLGELTKKNTKCMVKVNGVSLIDRVLSQLSGLNLNRLVIVVGYEGKNLIDYIGNRYDGILDIEYLENPIYDKTNNIYSLAIAKEKLAQDDTILLESDLIFEDSLLPLIVNHPDKNLALVAKYETWMDGTMVRIDSDRNIVNFVPKQAFSYNEVGEYYKTVNIYKFSREFLQNEYLPLLDAYCKVMGNNEYYEQVLRVITLLHSTSFKALPISNEKWYEIDDVQDLDIASTIFSDGEVKYHEYHKRFGGFWRFPQLLDYCYLVNPYFPTKLMRDEMRTNFDVLITEYPSGMLVNSLLAGKYFGIKQDYVLVGNGAAELIKVVMDQYKGDKVGIIFPTFDEYPNRLDDSDIVPFTVHNNDFSYTADDLMEFYKNKSISLLLLINPDNPSGHFMLKPDVLRLAEWCNDNCIKLIVDESFVDFTDGGDTNSLLKNDILENYPSLMVMKSISKSYGVPGLRLGVFVSADRILISKLKKEVPIWNINSFAEFYMQIFGKYNSDYKNACKKFAEERKLFYDELIRIPYLRVIPSQANYFLCEVIDRFSSSELTQKLIENDVLISNCGLKRCMKGANLIRLTIRGREDNKRLYEILKQL